MKRVQDWEAKLAELVESRLTTPFKWGDNDCCTFPIDVVKAVTGVEIFPVTWASKEEAVDVLREAGGIEAAWSEAFCKPGNQNWREMRRGDVGLFYDNGRNVGVVCVGERVCGPGDSGMSFWPTSAVRCFWRVG